MYHIRVDTSIDHAIIGNLVDLSKEALYCEEVGSDKTIHCHLFVSTDTPVQTIRNHIRKAGFSGNKSYSVSVVRDRLKTLAYIVKDGTFKNKNIPDSEIIEAQLYDVSVKEDIKVKRPKNVIQYIIASLEQHPEEKDITEFLIRRVYDAVIAYHLLYDIQIRRFQIQSYVDTIMFKLEPEYKEYYYQKNIKF
uniref:Replication protein n=1 Tax=Polar freshwater circular DNA virus TaxID=2749196 RepID=A0A7D7EYB1_9VIRU|nr:MAG: hypothetical protein [Polar freshwater circular DNA virus]